MEILRDLNELAKEVVKNFNENFEAKDCRIPQAFKDNVRTLKSFSIVYNDYSVIIKGDGVRSKDSYVPNQSFYMASYFIEYSYELSRYKQKIIPWLSDAGIATNELTAFFTHERDNGKKDIENGDDKFIKILNSIGYNGSDRNYLIKFVTDYDWWYGSKTIDRSDFFNSPVLSIMGLSASSNAAMALIVDLLTQNPEYNNLLLTQIENTKDTKMSNISLQQIFYGAPGTGKSKTIKDITSKAEKEGRVFRTTFHPDSDYSTFVGCYKPTKVKSRRLQRMNLSLEDLAKELGSYYSNEDLGKIVGIQKFCFDYYPYIDGEYMSVNVTKLLELAGVPKDYNVEINKYIKFCHLLPKQDPDKITYNFVPQAFTNSYIKAWSTEENVYLIIEEINRGSCAQIFGDLFQLLDRGDDGKSEYPIDADTDLGNYIAKELESSTRMDFPDGVKDGKKLVLPSNLFIWATMNTSDQSLFPIDSAFKRRWDWKYLPIENAEKGWKIKVNRNEYDWYQFLEAINKEVFGLTHSEDKQLGYFFAKAKDGIIDAETLVNKVYFYLWTDVFKDYDYESQKAFRKPNSNEPIAFKDFFKKGQELDEIMAEQVLINLELEKLNKPQDLFE